MPLSHRPRGHSGTGSGSGRRPGGDAQTVPSVSLRLIHRMVRPGNDLVGQVRRLKERDSYAHVNVSHFSVRGQLRGAYHAAQSMGDRNSAVEIDLGQQGQESSPPYRATMSSVRSSRCRSVASPYSTASPGLVPMGIIYRLEIIGIDHDRRQRMPVSDGPRFLFPQASV